MRAEDAKEVIIFANGKPRVRARDAGHSVAKAGNWHRVARVRRIPLLDTKPGCGGEAVVPCGEYVWERKRVAG